MMKAASGGLESQGEQARLVGQLDGGAQLPIPPSHAVFGVTGPMQWWIQQQWYTKSMEAKVETDACLKIISP